MASDVSRLLGSPGSYFQSPRDLEEDERRRQGVADFLGQFERPKFTEDQKVADGSVEKAAPAPSKPALPSQASPGSAFGRSSELDEAEAQAVRSGQMEFIRPSNPIRAERQNGRLVFTNQGSTGGEEVDLGEAARSVQPTPTRITSPYDRYRGEALSSATTRPGTPGGYIESQQDWSKVANPQAFEGFRETPTGQILAERETAMAQAEAEKARASALAEDPFLPEKFRVDAAAAPYEARAQGDYAGEQRREAFLRAIPAQAEAQAREELARNPSARHAPPAQVQAALEARVQELIEEKQRMAEMIFGNITLKGGGMF